MKLLAYLFFFALFVNSAVSTFGMILENTVDRDIVPAIPARRKLVVGKNCDPSKAASGHKK